jgi:hypothetical protein
VGPARLSVRYPGVFVRPDVFATHGHYLDCLTTVPAFERLGAGAMARIEGRVPEGRAVPDDFEALLAPMYAWLDALADSRGGAWEEGREGASASAWELLSASGPRPLKARAIASLFPLGIAGLNRFGIGPLKAELSGDALRDAGLTAMGDVVTRLGVEADHVLFGHTHRAGPLPADDADRWRAAGGPRLYNAGCWIDEPVFARGGPDSPYWAGRVIVVDREGPPRVERVVSELGRPT